MFTSLVVTFARLLWRQLFMFPKWLYDSWLMSSLLFVFWPPFCAVWFDVAVSCLYDVALLPFMCGLSLLLTASFRYFFAFIKPVIVSEIIDWFSFVIPTALILILMLRASVILLSMTRFLSLLCCNSRLSQPGRFSYYLFVNNIFGSLISTPVMTFSFPPHPPRPLQWPHLFSLPRTPKRHPPCMCPQPLCSYDHCIDTSPTSAISSLRGNHACLSG